VGVRCFSAAQALLLVRQNNVAARDPVRDPISASLVNCVDNPARYCRFILIFPQNTAEISE
jgi:hypothetical protein